MNIYEKLQQARCELQQMNIKKSGRNAFSKYDYFELKDFLPEINELFQKEKLCSIVSFNNDYATLEIVNSEKVDERIIFTSPMKELDLKGANAIQSLGGVETYQRRYLYMTALEIVENDLFDSGKIEPQAEQKPKTTNCIGKAELDQLQAFSLTNEIAKGIVKSFGYNSSKEITKDKFSKVLEAFNQAKELENG
jgi:hypothetical protein